MAWHDALTGLPNRRLFEDRVEQELVRARAVGEPVCMFFVDLDHFKSVNDTKGHAAGDDLIQQVSQRLVDTVRRQDTVARVGGDEFAVLLPGLSDQLSIDQLAQRSLEAMSRPYAVLGEEVLVVGLASASPWPPTTATPTTSCSTGPTRRCTGPSAAAATPSRCLGIGGRLPRRADSAIDERTLHADLVHALDTTSSSCSTSPTSTCAPPGGRGRGTGPLAPPRLGVLEPSSFISMAERERHHRRPGPWVLEQACRQLRTWLDHGLEQLRLSVEPGVKGSLQPRPLRQHRPHAHRDRGRSRPASSSRSPSGWSWTATAGQENIDRLAPAGSAVTIDDFGTGSASLDQHRFAFR